MKSIVISKGAKQEAKKIVDEIFCVLTKGFAENKIAKELAKIMHMSDAIKLALVANKRENQILTELNRKVGLGGGHPNWAVIDTRNNTIQIGWALNKILRDHKKWVTEKKKQYKKRKK